MSAGGDLVGRDVRVLIVDEFDDWQLVGRLEGFGEPLMAGLDLAPGPELLPSPLLEKPRWPTHRLREFKQTAPMTARELRRAEKRRRR